MSNGNNAMRHFRRNRLIAVLIVANTRLRHADRVGKRNLGKGKSLSDFSDVVCSLVCVVRSHSVLAIEKQFVGGSVITQIIVFLKTTVVGMTTKTQSILSNLFEY